MRSVSYQRKGKRLVLPRTSCFSSLWQLTVNSRISVLVRVLLRVDGSCALLGAYRTYVLDVGGGYYYVRWILREGWY
jgi:hypothetical protein